MLARRSQSAWSIQEAGCLEMRAQFVAYRAFPFLVLLAVDACFFLWSPELGRTLEAVVMVSYCLMPFVVLLGGGYLVRQLKPRSAFSFGMLSLSLIVATVHPLLSVVMASQFGVFEW